MLSRSPAWGFIAFWVFVFLFAAKTLNPLCLKLAPVALIVLMFYSYTKRFTLFATHLVLGFCSRLRPRPRGSPSEDRWIRASYG